MGSLLKIILSPFFIIGLFSVVTGVISNQIIGQGFFVGFFEWVIKSINTFSWLVSPTLLKTVFASVFMIEIGLNFFKITRYVADKFHSA